VANVDNAPNTLRFTAVKDGTLTVASTLSGTTAVMVGTTSSVGQYSSGVINLSGPNTYSGGTTLNTFNPAATPTLGFGSNSALGTGALDVLSDSSAMAGLQATNAGLTLSNPINLITVGVGGFGPKLFFSGSNDYTLSGAITGDDTTSLYMFSQTGLSVSLSGNNVGFLGNIYLPKGTLNFLSDNAAGGGTLDFGDASLGNAFFSSANPVLYGLTGTSGSIILGGTTNLILDASIGTHDFNYAGGISGTGGLTITAPMATSASAVALRGSSSYSGGTTVLNYGVVALDQSDSLGTGMVTLNAPNGGILVGPAVTMTNPLTFTSGALAGFGTYDPTGTATLTFNTGHIVSPGTGILFDGSGVSATGELTLATDVTFANGGSYVWTLQDVNRPDGYSLLNISGNLAITATSGGFVLKIATFDSSNFLGDANLLLGQPYTLPIITTTGSITGFSTSAFTIDASLFQSGAMAPSMFALTQSGSTIYLTFTAVPEPSTYALLALGLGAVFVPLRRRRKS
jgi:hypothetical protein